MQTVLAFDFGLRRIGIAIGQTITHTGSPLRTLRAVEGQPNWQDVAALLAEWQPDLLLVGLPLNMDATQSELSRRAEQFSRRLHGRFGKPVTMIDERLSSREARSIDNHNKHSLDALAAVIIVETWLHQQQLTTP